jgi:8-amino-7-oxononanoate synthase
LSKLQRLLEQAEPTQLQVVVTESIFSMDGDAANLKSLVELKRYRPFVLLLDEAHASGVYGPNGAGLAAEYGLTNAVDIFVVTFSKAAGCVGGAICASEDFCQAVINFGRAYIFSTNIPPAIAAGIGAAIRVMRDEPERQQRVRTLALELRERLQAKGMVLPAGDSPIVPIIVGEESAALNLAGKLLESGLLIGAVRPPTVPRGTSRLRLTVSCEHTQEEIDWLVKAVTG